MVALRLDRRPCRDIASVLVDIWGRSREFEGMQTGCVVLCAPLPPSVTTLATPGATNAGCKCPKRPTENGARQNPKPLLVNLCWSKQQHIDPYHCHARPKECSMWLPVLATAGQG